MVDLTPEQKLIIALVGDLDPANGDLPITPSDGIVAQNMAALWDRHADKAALNPALRAAYVTRDACNLILTILAPEVDTTPPIGGSVRLSQRVATYQARLAAAQNELERLEQVSVYSSSVGRPVVGLITRVTPNGPVPFGAPDPSSPRYSGSPLYPTTPKQWGRP